jgi:UDP-N-acetylmuramoyl-L-alanyl-D-glutamate--2,6-diaminopimelate ligase
MALRPEPRPVPLTDLVHGLPVTSGAVPDITVTGLTHDSVEVRPGDMFVALPGRTTHGARFAPDAADAGAVVVVTDAGGAAACAACGLPVIVIEDPRAHLGVLASRAYGQPATSLVLLGVTGTNGKTTVAAMVEAGLRAAGRGTGIIGTTGIRVDGQEYPSSRTTPEASDLHSTLARMLQDGVDTVVMEVSSIAIREHRVDGVLFEAVAFTNLTQDHLDYHGSMEEYFAAKADLFEPERARAGIVGIDDDWGRALVARAGVPVQTWSLTDPRADWHAERPAAGLVVVDPGGVRTPVRIGLPGSFNVANAVVAFALLRHAGVDAADAAASLAAVRVPGRMQVVVGNRATVTGIVDYAHSPDAVERALRAGREAATGRVVVVLGAGGDRDRGKRPQMGAVAARLADVVVVTDDNPRSEDPAAIRQAILDGALDVAPDDRAEVHEVGDRARAITVAVELARAGDVVLLLGKGHEHGQEVGGVVTPFDDATALAAALDTPEPL